MARLPKPGGDAGLWGDVLNDFLSQEHNPDGTLKRGGEIDAKYERPAGGIPKADLAAAAQSSLDKADNASAYTDAKTSPLTPGPGEIILGGADGTPRRQSLATAVVSQADRTIQVIGDIHIGWTAQERLDLLSADLHAQERAAALRVFIGDLVQNNGNVAAEEPDSVAFLNASSPSGWKAVIGNHDRYDTSWETIYGQPRTWVEDIGTDVRVIGISPDTYDGTAPITIPPATLTWLGDRLAETTRQCLICCHAPLQNSVMGGWYNSDSLFFSAQPDADIRAVLDAHANARAWISGHTHTPITSTSLINRVKLASGRDIITINVGAVAYSSPGAGGNGTPADPTTAIPDPNFTCFITCHDDRLEVRYRDSLTHEWRTWQSTLLTPMPKVPAVTTPSLSLAQPLLFLSPAGSRDAAGAVTVTNVGTVATTSGVYGTAWDTSAGGVRVPLAGHISDARGTLLLRLRLNSATVRRVLADMGSNSTGQHLLHLRYDGTPNTLIHAQHYTGAPLDGEALLTSPYGASHTALLTYMVRWNGPTLNLVLGDLATQATAIRADWTEFAAANNISVGIDRTGNNPANALIESAVIYDDWLTDAEFTAITQRQAAWAWDMLPTRAAAPAGASGPTYSNALPLLHLSVASSKDTDGAVTPTLNGTVTNVAGTYGQAWDVSAGQIIVPLVANGQRARGDHGTILIRATLGAFAGVGRNLFDLGGTANAGRGLFRMFYDSTGTNFAMSWWNATTPDGQASMAPPYGTSHSQVLTYMARWDGLTFTIGVGDHTHMASAKRTTALPLSLENLVIGSFKAPLGSAQWPGRIEDVLIVDRAITDTEFDTAAAWPTSWPWRLFG